MLGTLPPPPLSVLRGHEASVVSLKFMGLRELYSGDADGTVKVWNLRTMRCWLSAKVHERSVLSISNLLDQQIATSSRDSTIKIWDSTRLDTNEPISILRTGYDHFCNTTVFTPTEGRPILVAPGIRTSEILLWDTRAATSPVRSIAPPDESLGMVTSLCTQQPVSLGVDGGAGIIFAGYEDGSLSAYDIRAGSSTLCTAKLHSEPVFGIAAARTSKKGLRVLTGGGDAVLRRTALVLDGESRAGAGAFEDIDRVDLPHPGTSCIKYRPDGRLIVSAHWDHTVRVFDQKRLKPLAILRQHRDSVYAVDFPDPDSAEAMAVPIVEPTEHFDVKEEDTNYADRAVGTITPAVFATGSKDYTIALWSLFAESTISN